MRRVMNIKPSILPDILRRAAQKWKEEKAIVCGGANASYQELNQASDRLAHSLLNHGVVPGDRVLILLSNSLEFIAASFAVWKAGAIVVAGSPSIRDDHLCHILRDCAPQALIADRKAARRLDVRRHGLVNTLAVFVKGGKSRLPGLDGLRVASLEATLKEESSPALLRFNSASPDDVATITYCAGAGGCVKGVMNTHKNWLAGAALTGQGRGLTQQDALHLPVPLHGDLAMRQWLACVAAGAPFIPAGNLARAAKQNLNCNLTEAQAGLLRLGAHGLVNDNCQMPPNA